jgi:hypothetical protein
VFVARTFELRSGSRIRKVTLRLSVPEPDPTGCGWRCRLRLRGLSTTFDRHTHGEDGLQALLLALEMARVLLATTPLPAGARLTWSDDANLGVPALLTRTRDR